MYLRMDLEELLIYKVKEKKVLYDTSLPVNKDSKARNEAWEEISSELGLTSFECRDTWKKLRNSYSNACKRRLKQKGYHSSLGKWKYEDEMSFLIPYMWLNSCQKANTVSSNVELIVENDITKEIYCSRTKCSGSTSNVKENSLTHLSDPLEVTTNSNLISTDNEELSSSEESVEEEQLGFRIQKDIELKSNKRSPLGTSSHRNIKRKATEDLISTNKKTDLYTLIIKKSTEDKIDDDDIEEEYYLRLARMARKLKMPDRIKLRSLVSKIVMDTVIKSLPEH